MELDLGLGLGISSGSEQPASYDVIIIGGGTGRSVGCHLYGAIQLAYFSHR